MTNIALGVVLTTCAVICTGLPLSKDLPVLKETPKEVLFRVTDTHEPFLIQCVIAGDTKGVKYTWHKDGKPLSLEGEEVVQRHDEGSLVFLKPSPKDAGQYQCFAATELGTATTGIINVKQAYIKAQTRGLQKVKPVDAEPFKLDCPIPDSYPKPDISWRYQAVSDPEISSEVMDPRITVSPEGTLYITSIDKKDANKNFKYVCVAKTPATPHDVILAEYVIEEVLPNNEKNSEVYELYTSKAMTVRFGDRTYLFCIFGGIPQAHPDWFKDGVDVNGNPQDRITRYNRSKGKRLLIRDTWLTDSGTYKCVANNEVGKPKEHTMKLTVVAAPQVQNMPSSSIGVEPGKDITIPCQSTGLPAPKLTWTYNAQPLQASERMIINNSTKGNLTVADLTIKGAKVTDKGYYGCKAENEYGNLYGETVLNVA